MFVYVMGSSLKPEGDGLTTPMVEEENHLCYKDDGTTLAAPE